MSTQIEQYSSQVEQLQNAVANQRLSGSRTSLDDNEYTARFGRLNGAINNLSFNIRKNWQTIPPWLQPYVSPDAISTGKQEMTAVGRAVIARWLADEMFNKCFYPGLDPILSHHLKMIEINIRRFSYTLSSQEEYDALTTKVVNWRMATLEGLQSVINSPECNENRQDFLRKSTTNLTAHLINCMGDTPPQGVDGSVSMIIELAVSILNNLPLESRDVAIMYPLPNDGIQPRLMEVEKGGLPQLDGFKSESGEGGDEEERRSDKPRSGTLATMLGSGSASRKGSVVSVTSTGADSTAAMPPGKDAVRFAGFVAVEVRGRTVLVKAPVWTI